MPFAANPILIPAYQPGEPSAGLVAGLVELDAEAIVIVDDGSGAEYNERFGALPGVAVVPHAANLGKGAALKTGLNYALTRFPGCIGVVTADADGQNTPRDIVRVAESLRQHPDALVLGTRTFDGDVPRRSRMGNRLTRGLMRAIVGQKLSDTQTGLRGIPASLIPHLLRVPASGYEFELDMLIACKHQGRNAVQVPIETIYVDGNRSSHLQPVLDSMRIYFLLLRFSVVSLATAVLDNIVFAVAYWATGSNGRSQIAGRLLATIFYYPGARKAVFHSRQRHAVVLPKYVFLVGCNGLLSYLPIQFLHQRTGLGVLPSKLLVEGLLFIANFAIQRDFVFTKHRREVNGQAAD